MERMSVCYCGNDKVFPLILLSALSIVKFTPTPVTVYIMTMDLQEVNPLYSSVTEEHRAILEEAMKQTNEENRAVILNANEPYGRLLRGGKNEDSSYTPYTLLRLLFTEFDLPEKVLYLDADTMCCSDITQFQKIDLSDKEFGAALDQMGKFWIRHDYFNAGVMYLNLEQIRKTQLFVRARELLYRKKLYFSDQTVLNKYGRRGKLILPRKFNEQRKIKKDTVIKHFCRGIKWLPFFHVYNIKQSEVEKVHKKLKIFMFDDVYETYRAIAEKYGLSPLK